MAAPLLNLVSRHILTKTRHGINSKPIISRYLSSSCYRNAAHSDIRKVFMNGEVQSILKRITGFDLNRINAPQLMELQESEVRLLTDEQLREMQEKARKDAEERMVMPPVMDPREDIVEVMSDDPEIADAVEHKIIFTDVTFGIPDRERICVVRETDGKLRAASWTERERMTQIYFPLDGKKLRMPKMFLDENLSRVLDEGRYLYALERACLQFEPDDPDFIRITTAVYNHIQSHKLYDSIRSSRHFGPMAFYYARHKAIDHLLIFLLKNDELDSAVDLVRLLHIVHPDLDSAVQSAQQGIKEPIELLELYCELHSEEKGPLSLLIQSFREQMAEA